MMYDSDVWATKVAEALFTCMLTYLEITIFEVEWNNSTKYTHFMSANLIIYSIYEVYFTLNGFIACQEQFH